MPQDQSLYKRRWRFYRTSGGKCPIEEFLDGLSDEDKAEVAAAMKEVQEERTRVTHHIRNEIYEVIASGRGRQYRILFSQEGKHDHILLALEGFVKKTEKVPEPEIRRAQKRLYDWRSRGQQSSH
jgi:phage-related protein